MREFLAGILIIISLFSFLYFLYAVIKRKPVKKAAVITFISIVFGIVIAPPPEKEISNTNSHPIEAKEKEIVTKRLSGDEEIKSSKSRDYPFPSNRDKWNQATKILISFLEAWRNRDWDTMYNLCQETWKSNNPHGKDFLKNTYGNFKLMGAEIIEEIPSPKSLPESFQDVKVKLYVKDGAGNVKTIARDFRLICEVAPYKPVPPGIGKWGVNPLSGMP